MADDFDIQWNGDRIAGALNEPFHQANEILGRAFAKEITANKWPWPTNPSPRDIRDTSELLRSYAGEREGNATNPEHSHSWNIEYAMAVHEGATFKPDSRWGRIWTAITGAPRMPGRPWTEPPLDKRVLEDAFEKLARSSLGRIQ